MGLFAPIQSALKQYIGYKIYLHVFFICEKAARSNDAEHQLSVW